jgi:hypothetical protein
MAPTFSTRIFVPDPDFLPTKEQLLAVPVVLESVGIIDANEAERLRNELDAWYPDQDGPVEVTGKTHLKKSERDGNPTIDTFPYTLNGPVPFNDFNFSYDASSTSIYDDDILNNLEAEDDFDGRYPITEQEIVVFKEIQPVGELGNESYHTRLSFAHVDHYKMAPAEYENEVFDRLRSGLVAALLKKLQDTFHTPIAAKGLYH